MATPETEIEARRRALAALMGEEPALGALMEERRAGRLATDIGRAGAMAAEAISGARAPMDLYTNLEKRAEEPVVEYVKRQQALASQKVPAAGKAPKSTDPNSPESKRAQMLVRAVLADKFSDEEINQLTEADAENALKYGTLSGQREVTRESISATNERDRKNREQRGQQWAERKGLLWADMDLEERELAERVAAREAAAAATQTKTTRELNERNVGGYEFDPMNPPSPDASKKMAEVTIQAKTLNQGLDALEKLYNSSGTEIVGETAGVMGAEWKNLTDLLRNMSNMGVPNGKDYEMLALQLENPTELRSLLTSKARGLAQMRTVRDQIRRLVAATAEAYKFRPTTTPAAPKRTTPQKSMPKGPDGSLSLETPPPRRPVSETLSKDGTKKRITYSDGSMEVVNAKP